MIWYCLVFFFNDPPTTEIYTLSLHDALPIYDRIEGNGGEDLIVGGAGGDLILGGFGDDPVGDPGPGGSEEHTAELQSRQYLVCRLLLEKKKKKHLPVTQTYQLTRVFLLVELL